MVLKYIRKLFSPGRKDEAEPLPPLPHHRGVRGTDEPEVVQRPIPRNLIDMDAVKVIRRLTRFGHTAYLVGGGVRDLLLGRTPKDFDIGTSARPNEIKKLFRNCRIIGRRFRLAHIFFGDKILEVATFRADVTEETEGDGDLLIRSDNVFGTPQTDALRRDFTINALFYDVDKGNVIDYVGGLDDLDSGVLKTIGDPDIRMREDPIRILRALRLSGRLGLKIDPATRKAIRAHREDIRKAAVPRILEDLLRMLRGGGAEGGFRQMLDSGVMEIVLPELHGALAPKRGRAGAGATGIDELFWKVLRSIDRSTNRGTEFSNPTLFTAMLSPIVVPILDAEQEGQGAGEVSKRLDEATGPIQLRLNLPRRDRDRMRQILLAQKRFAGSRRGRRFSVSGFISRPFFPEAFDLFEVLCSATGRNREELRRWRERIASVASGRGAPPPARSQESRRSRGRGGRDRARGSGRSRGEDSSERSEGSERSERGARKRGGRRRRRGRDSEEGAEIQVFPTNVPERPDLTEEDVALVYGTVLEPEPGEERARTEAPRRRSGGGTAAGEGGGDGPARKRRRRKRGGRRRKREGASDGVEGGPGASGGGESSAPTGSSDSGETG